MLEWVQRPAARQGPVRLQHGVDRGSQAPVAASGRAAWEGHERTVRAHPQQRNSRRSRGRRPLQPERRPGRATRAKRVRVTVGPHAHRAARAGTRHWVPEPPDPAHPREAQRLRFGSLRPREVAAEIAAMMTRKRPGVGQRAATPRTSVPGSDPGERPEGDRRGSHRCPASPTD